MPVELSGAGAFTRDDATLALIGGSEVAAAVVFPIAAATRIWWAMASGEITLGLLPIRVDRRWRYPAIDGCEPGSPGSPTPAPRASSSTSSPDPFSLSEC